MEQAPEQTLNLDIEGLILRRADPDDCDQISHLVEIGKDDVYNRVYAYPRILKLIENAFLAISVVDHSGNVLAFAAFEDYPQGIRGMQDEKHCNYWEQFFQNAFKVDDFSSMNTLWLTYFVCGGPIAFDQQKYAFKRILQTVYTQHPDIIGILFLARGDADEEDHAYCFEPLGEMFKEVELRNEAGLRDVRGIPPTSKVFFSSRVLLIPFIEIRRAKQEDHDDLADVFNNQSETVTEAYGEYFLAELIANQKNDNKALVAQVKDKAVGLMGLTDDVDISLLHQCFDLEHYDNLLKPEFMDAIKRRRDYLQWKMEVDEEQKKIDLAKRRKQELMQCNIIAQRISLQEHLIDLEERIMAEIDEYTQDEEKVKTLDRKIVIELFESWLSEFELYQPGEFFKDHPSDDTELVCSIQSKLDFLLKTLEYFGLPKDYINGVGHFPNFEQERLDAKAKKKKTKGGASQANVSALKAKIKKRQREAGRAGVDLDARPTYFDIEVFRKSYKRFIACNGELRSKIRKMLLADMDKTKKVFCDEHKEQSFKKIIDVNEFAELLSKQSFNLDSVMSSNLGAILLCFGEIEHEEDYGLKKPPETEEFKRAVLQHKAKVEDRERMIKEAEEAGEKLDPASLPEIPKLPTRDPEMTRLFLISITDLKFSLQKMFEFDKALFEMEPQVQKYDIQEEQLKMSLLTKQMKKKYYEEEENHEMPPEPSTTYSENPEIQTIVSKLDDLTSIPDAPDSLKNAFAITLFCMEAAFDSRSTDFLQHAFDEFPDRDYLILLQPHTVVEQQLLRTFTQPSKKTINTFQHVLYVMHRDSLYSQDMNVRRVEQSDLEEAKDLVDTLDESKEFYQKLYDAAINPGSTNYGFVAKVEGQIIGSFVLSKDVNLDYYTSHFHVIDQILINEQERNSHTRLVHSCINPIFERSTRFMLKELLRLTDKNCMYFEVNHETIIPSIFNEFLHIRSRRFPHFLDRKWDHQRFVPEDVLRKRTEDVRNKVDGCARDPLDETDAPFGLCFTTRRHLSEPKIIKNSRIVVVGASDTSISFIEALLSINYLHFTNIVLIAPGGLPHQHFEDKRENLKAYSTSYTREELKKLMLESRVRVINGRMVDIDKHDKNIILNDDSVIPYDTLVLGMGLQDNTLNKLEPKYKSASIMTLPEVNRADQILSIDDPQLYEHLKVGGNLINMLTDRRKIKNCVIYGRTLHTYCCIQGLIARGVRPEQIILAVPQTRSHLEKEDASDADLPHVYPDAFEDQEIEDKIQKQLTKLGVTVLKNYQLFDIGVDPEEGLEYVAFKDLEMGDVEESDDAEEIEEKEDEEGSAMGSDNGATANADEDDEEGEALQKNKRPKRKKNEKEYDCRVLITAGHRDVDMDVFLAIHNNGLVYNGRLIVDKSFQATDYSIFAAGSLCEFTGRYKAQSQGRDLKMDRYNGREMGSRLARSVFESYDTANNFEEQELPQFYLPSGQGGMLPGNILYYNIKSTNPLIFKENYKEPRNRKSLTCDNLDDETGKGHFIKFNFNSIGLIDSVTYIGSEEVVLQSLWSLVGLHENYLNQLTSRYDQGIIPNVVEFLSENWAIALYHEWFGDFCLRMRQSVEKMADVQAALEQTFEATKNGEGLSREQIAAMEKKIDPKTVRMIQEETLEFIKTNMNHLPMYYIPGKEFQ